MTPSVPFLPYGRQDIDEADIAAVVGVLRGDWLTQGPAVEAFERALAARCGAGHAVACSSGAAALHLAGLALDPKPGDAVVVPAVTFLATANGPFFAGAEIVFADVDPDTGLMGPEHAEAALRRAERAGLRVRALFPVHLAGQTVDIASLGALAEAHGLAVIADACHAIGGEHRIGDAAVPVGAGTLAAMNVFSFHPVKTVAAGEGGAVTTDDPALAARLRRLRNHGIERDPARFIDRGAGFDADGSVNPWYYEMGEPGFNYRITDLQCALALSQLGRIERFVERRRALAARYEERLRPLAPLVRPLERVSWCRPAWHLNVVLIDFAALGRSRAAVMAGLRTRGIGSQVHYIPLHRQPFWRRRHGDIVLPGAESYYARALSLPLFPGMTDADVDRVVEAMAAACGLD